MDRKETKDKLWELHRALVEFFLEQLRNPNSKLKGSTLECMRSFLRDNSITLPESDMVRDDDSLSQLEDMTQFKDPADLEESVEEYQEQDNGVGFKMFQ